MATVTAIAIQPSEVSAACWAKRAGDEMSRRFNFVCSLGSALIPLPTCAGDSSYPRSGGNPPQGWTRSSQAGFTTVAATSDLPRGGLGAGAANSPQTHVSPQVRMIARTLKCQLHRLSGLQGQISGFVTLIISPEWRLLPSFLWQSCSCQLKLKVVAQFHFCSKKIRHSLRGSGRISGTAWPRRRWYRTGALRCVNRQTLQRCYLRPLY